MDTKVLLQRAQDCVIHECDFFARCATAGHVMRLGGIVAGVNPAAPDRSLFNGVTYQSSHALRQHYDEITALYEQAGVRAWTVWTHVGDTETPLFLAERGHKFDGDPVAMAATLSELVLPAPGDLVWEKTYDPSVVGEINDRAYGFPPPAFAAAMQRWPDDSWHGYVARIDGKPVATLLTAYVPSGDCGIAAVATLPEYRRKALATRLLAVALEEAKRKGLTTTSLQASPLGTGVYAALGYRDLGRMAMWEHRTPR